MGTLTPDVARVATPNNHKVVHAIIQKIPLSNIFFTDRDTRSKNLPIRRSKYTMLVKINVNFFIYN